MAMQGFSQILMSVFLIFFLYEKNSKYRAIVFGFLAFTFLLGFKIHNTELYFLIGVFIIELLVLIPKFLSKISGFFALGCGIVSQNVVEKISSISSGIRGNALSSSGSFIISAFYYLYHFLISNMFIGFVIPAVYETIKSKNFKNFYYFLFVIFGAFITWWWQGWTIWGVTRVFLWLPLVLLVPFINWLEKQSNNIKIMFYLIGLVYFIFNIWYFIIRVQDMACS